VSALRITGVLASAALASMLFASPSFAEGNHGNSWKFNHDHTPIFDTHTNQIGQGHLKHRGLGHHKDHVAVPEIDAASGMAALAVVLAGLTLVWERRRYRKTV